MEGEVKFNPGIAEPSSGRKARRGGKGKGASPSATSQPAFPTTASTFLQPPQQPSGPAQNLFAKFTSTAAPAASTIGFGASGQTSMPDKAASNQAAPTQVPAQFQPFVQPAVPAAAPAFGRPASQGGAAAPNPFAAPQPSQPPQPAPFAPSEQPDFGKLPDQAGSPSGRARVKVLRRSPRKGTASSAVAANPLFNGILNQQQAQAAKAGAAAVPPPQSSTAAAFFGASVPAASAAAAPPSVSAAAAPLASQQQQHRASSAADSNAFRQAVATPLDDNATSLLRAAAAVPLPRSVPVASENEDKRPRDRPAGQAAPFVAAAPQEAGSREAGRGGQEPGEVPASASTSTSYVPSGGTAAAAAAAAAAPTFSFALGGAGPSASASGTPSAQARRAASRRRGKGGGASPGPGSGPGRTPHRPHQPAGAAAASAAGPVGMTPSTGGSGSSASTAAYNSSLSPGFSPMAWSPAPEATGATASGAAAAAAQTDGAAGNSSTAATAPPSFPAGPAFGAPSGLFTGAGGAAGGSNSDSPDTSNKKDNAGPSSRQQPRAAEAKGKAPAAAEVDTSKDQPGAETQGQGGSSAQAAPFSAWPPAAPQATAGLEGDFQRKAHIGSASPNFTQLPSQLQTKLQLNADAATAAAVFGAAAAAPPAPQAANNPFAAPAPGATQPSAQQQQSAYFPSHPRQQPAAAQPQDGSNISFSLGQLNVGSPGAAARGARRTTPRKGHAVAPPPAPADPAVAAAAFGARLAAATAAPQPPPAPAAAAADRPDFTAAAAAEAAKAAMERQRRAALEAARKRSEKHKDVGNKAYEAARYKEAEVAYSTAIKELEAMGDVGQHLAVLHSNRAGASLMTGWPRSALRDATAAIRMDPKFMKAYTRAATCHSRVGDFASARATLERALDMLSAASPYYSDVSGKLAEVQHWEGACARLAATFTEGFTQEQLPKVKKDVQDLWMQVPYHTPVIAMRCIIKMQMGDFGGAVAAVEPHAEVAADPAAASCPSGAWRHWLALQVRYHEGELPAAVACGEQLVALLQQGQGASGAPPATIVSTTAPQPPAMAYLPLPSLAEASEVLRRLRDMVRLKDEGNAAHKAGRHQEAVDKYSAALALAGPPGYAAVLHSNRAASHQSMGNTTDALADTGRALALNPGYIKAASRMCTLLIEVRRAEAAVSLLDGLIKSPPVKLSSADQAGLQSKLTEAKAAAKWQKTPDHYKLLGLSRSCGEDEVRKAYKKAALKYHPDKAIASCKHGEALGVKGVRLLSAAEVEARLRGEANTLFNFINTAHEQLADARQRRTVDQLLDVEQPRPASSRPAPYGGGYGASYSYDPHFDAGAYYGGYGSRGQQQGYRYYGGNAKARAGGSSGQHAGGGQRGSSTWWEDGYSDEEA